ncbi:MAG: response regulator transcription factor [Flavobacterium sp.]|nr:response regulator transcription factor [Flavobacterium sp.]
MAVKILMIDDHPLQIEGYKSVLSFNAKNLQLQITAAYTCESAYNIITDKTNLPDFDLVFLDRNLPPFKEKNIYSGDDLAQLIKIHLPETKIVVLTSHSEPLMLYNIVKKIAPAGLLVKSDFDGEELLVAFDKILSGETYQSEIVKKTIKLFLEKEMFLDVIDREILGCIAVGTKTVNMPSQLNLSLSAIEKRKSKIKIYFGIDRGSDEDIIKAAKQEGFI